MIMAYKPMCKVIRVLFCSLCVSLASVSAATVYQAEFNTDGEFANWVDYSGRGNATVSGGAINFSTLFFSQDVQLRTAGSAGAGTNPLGAGIDVTQYDDLTLEIRIRQGDVGGERVDVYVRTGEYDGAAAGNLSSPETLAGTVYLTHDNIYERYTFDIKSAIESLNGSGGDGVLRAIRIDPQNGSWNTSSIDSIKIFDASLSSARACTYLLICCRGANRGVEFLINGQWNPWHDYSDISQVRDIMQKLKTAGIQTVIIDVTNQPQFGDDWLYTQEAVNNIETICGEKNMTFCFLSYKASYVGGIGEFNGYAQQLWDNWGQSPYIQKYGYGDDRPILVAFDGGRNDGTYFWGEYNAADPSDKTYIDRFRIVDCGSNTTDGGWGYRCIQESSGNDWVRFVSTNGGCGLPETWYKVTESEWITRVTWARGASRYFIYGGYDESNDGHMWGIAETKNTDAVYHYNWYPGNDPWLYYNVVYQELIGADSNAPTAPNGLTASEGAYHVILDWEDNTEFDHAKYSVYRSTTSSSGYVLVDGNVPASQYSDYSLFPGQTYYYVVTASDYSENESVFSSEASAIPDGTGYAPLYQFEFEMQGDRESWIGVNGAENTIQDISINNSNGVLTCTNGIVQQDPQVKLTYQKLLLPIHYESWDTIELRIRQLDETGTAPQSWQFSGTLGEINNSLNLGEIKSPLWTITNESDGWIVANISITSLGSNIITDIRLDPLGNYNADYFELDYIRLTGVPLLVAPDLLVATADSSGGVRLDWEEYQYPGLMGYRIYRASSPGGPYTQIAYSNVNTYLDSDVADNFGTPYFYVITTLNTLYAESSYSNEAAIILYRGDLTFDGKVDYEDMVELGEQWLNLYDMYTFSGVAHDWLLDQEDLPQKIILFEDEFDGNGHGYNPIATTAQAGDYDWVDFGNRMTASDISIGIEGYTTASGGTETVLAGASGAGQNDPQIRSDFDIGFTDARDITDIVLRIRVDLNDDGAFNDTLTEADVDLWFGNVTYVVPGAGNIVNAGNQNFYGLTGFTSTLTSEANGWHVFAYSCDLGRLSSMRSLRIDPVNNNPGKSFEIDYIKIKGVLVPE